MGRKNRTFASQSERDRSIQKCDVCGEAIRNIKLVASQQSDSGSWKFKENMVKVCKCNEEEVYE